MKVLTQLSHDVPKSNLVNVQHLSIRTSYRYSIISKKESPNKANNLQPILVYYDFELSCLTSKVQDKPKFLVHYNFDQSRKAMFTLKKFKV